jgi:flagellar motor switch protein FliN
VIKERKSDVMKKITQGQSPSSQDKAAIVMLGLSDSAIKALLSRFCDEEVRRLSLYMNRVGVVEPSVLNLVAQDFLNIMRQGKGAVVELDKQINEPVDIMVNDQKIAKGEVVLVGENIGVTITELFRYVVS